MSTIKHIDAASRAHSAKLFTESTAVGRVHPVHRFPPLRTRCAQRTLPFIKYPGNLLGREPALLQETHLPAALAEIGWWCIAVLALAHLGQQCLPAIGIGIQAVVNQTFVDTTLKGRSC